MATFLPPHETKTHPNSVGRPGNAVEFAIFRNGKSSPHTSDVGEVAVRGPNIMMGYWNAPEATRQVLTQDGWLLTGDIGSIDDHGYLTLQGRRHDMIISGGENIHPAEVERVLSKHPDIDEIAVVGLHDPHWGEQVTAFIVTRNTLKTHDIRTWAKDLLAHYKLPRRLIRLDALPRNATGKLLRHKLHSRGPKG